MLRLLLLAGVVALAAAGVAPRARTAGSSQTLPVSGRVLATIVTRDDRLVLMALWRGAHHWFLKGTQHSGAAGSGQNGVVWASLHYGDRDLELSFDGAGRKLLVQGKAYALPADANVVLIDGVDTPAGARVVGMLKVESQGLSTDPRQGSLAPLFKASKELAPFLQCDGATATPFATIVCNDLR